MFRKIYLLTLCLFIFNEQFFSLNSNASANIDTLFKLNQRFFAIGLNAVTNIKTLPRSYSGTYLLENSNYLWDVSISFSDVIPLQDGKVAINGTVFFISKEDRGKTYESDIRAVINPETLNFEMEEVHTDNRAGFIPMTYRGKISSDLIYINAECITSKDNKIILTLKANAL